MSKKVFVSDDTYCDAITKWKGLTGKDYEHFDKHYLGIESSNLFSDWFGYLVSARTARRVEAMAGPHYHAIYQLWVIKKRDKRNKKRREAYRRKKQQ